MGLQTLLLCHAGECVVNIAITKFTRTSWRSPLEQRGHNVELNDGLILSVFKWGEG